MVTETIKRFEKIRPQNFPVKNKYLKSSDCNRHHTFSCPRTIRASAKKAPILCAVSIHLVKAMTMALLIIRNHFCINSIFKTLNPLNILL